MTDTPTPPNWAKVPRTTVRWSLARIDGDTTDVAVGDRVTLHPTITGIAVVDPLDTNPVSVILEPCTYKVRGDGALVDDQGDMAAVLAVDDPRVATPGGRAVQWIARHETRHDAIRFPAADGETVELSRWVAATAPERTQRSWVEQLVDAAEDATAGLAAAVGAGEVAVTAAGQAADSAATATEQAVTATEQAGLATTARTGAEAAAADAEVSADAAGASASAAAGSESAVAGHASTAAGSADSAASSATAAASSASAASSSAATAGGHATDAEAALTATVEARDLTLGYRDEAADSAAAATTARDTATAAATTAEQSAADAADSATSAVTAKGAAEAARDDAIHAKEVAESFDLTASAEHVSSDTPISVEVTGTAPTFNLDLNIPRGRDAYIESATPPADTEMLWLDTSTPSLPESGSPFELRGYGMPNGVVTASPGTYYTDNVGTNGAWRWLKTSGTGNTGWTVVFGDTGWRVLDSTVLTSNKADFVPSTDVVRCRIRRVGDHCAFEVRLAGKGTSGFVEPFYTLPTGFGPTADPWAKQIEPSSELRARHMTFGNIYIERTNDHKRIGIYFTGTSRGGSGCLNWSTSDAWPTTLPGTAV